LTGYTQSANPNKIFWIETPDFISKRSCSFEKEHVEKGKGTRKRTLEGIDGLK